MRFSLIFPLLSGLLFPFISFATTIIPYANLASLYAASDAVVLVRAGPSYESPTTAGTYYDCDFTVSISLKGGLVVDDVFPLRQLSRYDNAGYLDIVGDFVPKAGHNYLVFLKQNAGTWRLMMLSYYVFETTEVNGIQYLTPVEQSLSMATFPRPDGTIAEPITTYRKDALLQMLQEQGKGSGIPWDGRRAQATTPLLDQVSDRVLPTGCDFDLGTGLSRWQNDNINVYYDVTSAPADALLRYTNVLSNLNFQYSLGLVPSGSTDFTPMCGDGSIAGNDFITFSNSLNGAQTILLFFEDPCNEISNANVCNGGVLGIGGGYTLSSTHVFKGDTWFNATWGYAVINNGARACLNDTDFETLLTHELTHSLRMDHLDFGVYPGNNMNPLCCNLINDKDRECMNYVYGVVLPVELTAFNARADKETVTLTWTTAQETNNDYFLVERSDNGLDFKQLATVEAGKLLQVNTYTVHDDQPTAGTNYYKLSQTDRDGETKELGIRAVNYKGGTGGYTLVPNPVSGNFVVLASGAEEPAIGSLQIFNSTGRLVYELNNGSYLATNRLELPLGNLPNGVYWLKINENGRAETLKLVRL